MLGRKYAFLASTALVASLALAACDSNNAPAVVQDVDPVAGPLGLSLGEAVAVMSADANMHLVRVSDQHSTVTLNELTFDLEGEIDTFSITFGLPDGSEVTITDEDAPDSFSELSIGDGEGLRLTWNDVDDGNRVGIMIGLGLDTDLEGDAEADIAGDALFALARIDPDGDNPDFGVDTYMVTGAETEAMPVEGSADYSGVTIASLYHHGVPGSDHLTGSVYVEADFEDGLVDIDLEGSDGDISGDWYYLSGDNLAIDGSGYGGTISGVINPEGFDETNPYIDPNVPITNVSWNAVGDVLGAFFGDDAEATAGVFGASGTDLLNHDVEVVGGFAAYEDEPEP